MSSDRWIIGGRVCDRSPALVGSPVQVVMLDLYRYSVYGVPGGYWISCVNVVKGYGLVHGYFSEEEVHQFLGYRIQRHEDLQR